MFPRLLLGIVGFLFAAFGRCDSSFINPGDFSTNWTDNAEYDVGDSIKVQWETDEDLTKLILWQDHPGAGEGNLFFYMFTDNDTSTNFTWNTSFEGFSTNLSSSEDAVFHFALYISGTEDVVANSANFNVSLQEDDETASVTSDPTQTQPAVVTTVTKNNDVKTVTVHPAPANSPTSSPTIPVTDSGLSTGAVAGISVGVTIAGILVLASLGFFVWKRFIRQRSDQTFSGQGEQLSNPHSQEYNKAELADTQKTRSEMGGTKRVDSELGDTQIPVVQSEQNQIRSVPGLHEAP